MKFVWSIFLVCFLSLITGCECDDTVFLQYSPNAVYTISKYKLIIETGLINAPGKKDINNWTDTTVNFWTTTVNLDIKCIQKALRYKTIIFIDQDRVQNTHDQSKSYAGITYMGNHTAYISYGPYNKPKYIFIHEISHFILHSCHKTDNDHIFFKDTGFCALVDGWCI